MKYLRLIQSAERAIRDNDERKMKSMFPHLIKALRQVQTDYENEPSIFDEIDNIGVIDPKKMRRILNKKRMHELLEANRLRLKKKGWRRKLV